MDKLPIARALVKGVEVNEINIKTCDCAKFK